MTSFTKGEGGSQFCSTMDEAVKRQTIKFDRGRGARGSENRDVIDEQPLFQYEISLDNFF